MIKSNLPLKRREGQLSTRRENESPVMTIQNEMNRLFDQFFSDPFTLVPLTQARITSEFLPRVDISETPKDLKVTAEMPGMDEKDINISLENDILTLSGEKKNEIEEKEQNFHRVERSYGSFQRSIPLACEIDDEKVSAVFKNGVLTITLPKAASALKEARKIAIKKE